jgi:hypothetical protein
VLRIHEAGRSPDAEEEEEECGAHEAKTQLNTDGLSTEAKTPLKVTENIGL